MLQVIECLEECKELSEACLRTPEEEQWLRELKEEYELLNAEQRFKKLFK